MRTGAAAGRTGYFHEALLYGSDDEFLAVAVPFLVGGAEAGEPTVVALGERTAGLVRAELPAGADVAFLGGGDTYARPAAAIRTYRELLARLTAGGAGQVRIIGELQRVHMGSTWDWWARYEAAINRAFDDWPLWSMCAYDTRVASPAVVGEVLRTHPFVACPDGSHRPSPAFVEPAAYLAHPPDATPDPLERTAPAVSITDPTAAQARAAAAAVAGPLLGGPDADGLVIAVSELVTNAHRHGAPPVRLDVWAAADRVVATVRDGGAGPADPYAGLLPAGDGTGTGGLGLWIAFQSCNHVALRREPGAFTVRLTAGNACLPD
ncbi:anti-sigma factor RsbA family regulatory protein [Spirilliplanes yamanashiensis]|uniref:Anti-sigma regulatory factor (Ser/Thr protein kinase) n=1 Tax=Spirilliplanes yamanashiensis TaxID=42233 RepID=A0A8J3YD38_9ACTN|nr:anti-sigma factor RsbA family regulatory protein [Spirilliplanes yamanashiensis]MDP9819075.1 anti-sigma regulatory factor (Ser/Thr protein kinase) [Spirilliplanes yamanashiensis]GIJ05530.1 hypothetical protein Sya03_48820 [Spirilliplanes yamanashiensis]